MDACGAGQLGQAADVILHLALAGHHQVGQLVDDDDDAGHELLAVLQLGVVAVNGAHGLLLEFLVAVHHLRHGPGQRAGGLVGVGHHGNQQVGDAVVALQLHHLGIHQDQPYLPGGATVKQGVDHGVDAHRLAGARGAGDEQVGHAGQVAHDGRAGNVLAQGYHQRGFGLAHGLTFQHLAECDGGHLPVGHLHAHQRLAGDGRLDADGLDLHVHGDVLAQVGDLRHLDARGQLQLKPGNGRAVGHMAHLGGHLEGLQRLLQALGTHGVLLLADAGLGLGQLEQVHAGVHIGRGKLHLHLLTLGRILAGRQLQVGLPAIPGRLLLQPGRGNRRRGGCGGILPGRCFRPGGLGLLLCLFRLAGGAGGKIRLRISPAPGGGRGGGSVLPALIHMLDAGGPGSRGLLHGPLRRGGFLRHGGRYVLLLRYGDGVLIHGLLGRLRLPAAKNAGLAGRSLRRTGLKDRLRGRLLPAENLRLALRLLRGYLIGGVEGALLRRGRLEAHGAGGGRHRLTRRGSNLPHLPLLLQGKLLHGLGGNGGLGIRALRHIVLPPPGTGLGRALRGPGHGGLLLLAALPFQLLGAQTLLLLLLLGASLVLAGMHTAEQLFEIQADQQKEGSHRHQAGDDGRGQHAHHLPQRPGQQHAQQAAAHVAVCAQHIGTGQKQVKSAGVSGNTLVKGEEILHQRHGGASAIGKQVGRREHQ